jgi:hypothetical protein
MTEPEWNACTDPRKMLEFLRGRASDRKLRLFGCACCRHIWDLLTDRRSREAVEVAEGYADGQAFDADLDAAYDAAFAVVPAPGGSPAPEWVANSSAPFAAAWVAHPNPNGDFPLDVARYAAAALHAQCRPETPEEADQCRLLRDLFGNPFRPVSLAPAWMTPTVLDLAQAAYDNRLLPSGLLDNSRLAVLADALEEAGCTDPDMLGHLRGPGTHVRGCWVIDLLLGKE